MEKRKIKEVESIDVSSPMLEIHDPTVGDAGASRYPAPTLLERQVVARALKDYIAQQNENPDMNNWLRA